MYRIIRMKSSRRMRWTGHVARMRAKRNAFKFLVGKPNLDDLDIDVRIILKRILER
jgi:hypothetical protein